MRLEPRLMFDGAIADTVADTVVYTQADIPSLLSTTATELETSTETESPLSETPLAVANRIFVFNNLDEKSENDQLSAATAQTQSVLEAWFEHADFFADVETVFANNSTEWQSNAGQLQESFLQGEYKIHVDFLSNEDLSGALAGYSASGTTSQATIYLNQDWLSSASAEAITAVLLEEIGHDFDQYLNEGIDTVGDEGHNFSSLLLYGKDNASTDSNNDKSLIEVDGQTIQVEQAGPFTIAQVNFVPMDEADITTALSTIDTGNTFTTVVTSTIAIAPTQSGTVIVYDHWEDGYEADIANPLQASTEIWGDGDLTNGIAPGTIDDLIVSGQSIILQNNVDSALPSTDYDARDKIGSTKAISVTRAGWDNTVGENIGGAVNIIDSSNAGKNYIIPVGQQVATDLGLTWNLFEYTSVHIIAYTDGTTIDIDSDGDGGVDQSIVLNQGETHFIDGGVLAGATVTASENIGVYVLAGDVGIQGNRWYTITPTEQWSNSYYAPVAETDPGDTDVRIFLYNPSASNITINYETLDGADNPTTSSVIVNANSYQMFSMPASAAYVSSSGGEIFYAVSTIDDLLIADWGYNLVPESSMTSDLIVPWGPGNSFSATFIANQNPLWVTASRDTDLYIDSATVTVKSADGTIITGTMVDADTYRYSVTRLESYRVYDDSDHVQSGLRVYTQDGTTISAAWGADPDPAIGGNSFDLGYSIMPFPDYLLTKTATEYGGDGDGLIELSEQILYTLTVSNRLTTPLENINFTDTLPSTDLADYISGSTTLTIYDASNNVIYSDSNLDGGTGTFPLSGAGYTITDTDTGTAGDQGLEFGERAVITYRVQVRDDVNATLVAANYEISTSASLGGDDSGTSIDQKNSSVTAAIAIPSTAGINIVDSNDTDAGHISVTEGSTLSSATFSVYPLNDVTSLLIEGIEVVSATYPLDITTTEGILTVTDFTPATGLVTYNYAPSSSSYDHSSGAFLDNISIDVTDLSANTATDTLIILITDTSPVANADIASMLEDDAGGTLSGNTLTGATTADTPSADLPTTVVGLASGTTNTDLDSSATLDTNVSGSYGTLLISADGSYLYTLDTSNPTVEVLAAGDTLFDIYTYTITDGDGSLSHNTITLIINGVDEPLITIPDLNDPDIGELTLQEGETITGATFTVDAPNGLDKILIESREIGLAELQLTSSSPINIATSQGLLTVTNFSTALGRVTYSYTSNTLDHSGGNVLDIISVTATDLTGRSSVDEIDILITDTAPVANADTNTITDFPSAITVSGNAITVTGVADTPSLDTPMTVTGLAAGNTATNLIDTATLDTAIIGTYGDLTIAADGSYTYSLNINDPVIDALSSADTVLDTFTYTIIDDDGSVDNTTITLTITGADEPSVTVSDVNGVVDGDLSVPEDGSSVSSFTLVAAPNGVGSLDIQGTSILGTVLNNAANLPISVNTDKGILTITAYDSTSGVLDFSYALSPFPLDHSSGVLLDAITITITDTIGFVEQDDLNIFIEDSVPTANSDSRDIYENSVTGTISGNFVTEPNLADDLGLDVNNTVVGLASGYTLANLVDLSTVGTAVTGSYGTLLIQSNGDFIYTLDQTNPVVSSLQDGMSVLDTFTYTLQDTDGSADYAGIGITTIGVDIPPTASISNESKSIAVPENGILSGQTFILSAPEGLNDLNIAGVSLTTLDLLALNSTPLAIETDKGTLVLSGYDPVSGAITYSYSPSPSAAINGPTTDSIVFQVTDNLGATATTTFALTIVGPRFTPTGENTDTMSSVFEQLSSLEPVSQFSVLPPAAVITESTQAPQLDNLLFGDTSQQPIADARERLLSNYSSPERLVLAHEAQITQVCQLNWLNKLGSSVEEELNDTSDEEASAADLFSPSTVLTDTSSAEGDALTKLQECQVGWLNRLSESAQSDLQSVEENTDFIPSISDGISEGISEGTADGTSESSSDGVAETRSESSSEGNSTATANQFNEHQLRVHKNIPTQNAFSGADLNYVVPIDTFLHTDTTAEVSFSALMVDGTDLPTWLIFNPSNGEFSGEAPADFEGELQIKIIARDQEGRQAETMLDLNISAEDDQGHLIDHPNLSDQLAAQNRWKIASESGFTANVMNASSHEAKS